jgi:S1-C subfamily serine protease
MLALILGSVAAGGLFLGLMAVLVWSVSRWLGPTAEAAGPVAASVSNNNVSPPPVFNPPRAPRQPTPPPAPQPGPSPTQQPSQPPTAQVTELFEDRPDRPAPQVLVPALNRVGKSDFDFPKFVAGKGGRASPKSQPGSRSGDGKMSLEEIKKAVAYIKVEAGENSATGSGFLLRADGSSGLVATNCHVVAEALVARAKGPGNASKVKVVFDSGLPSEHEHDGEVVAADGEVDLALIRVRGLSRMPRPINPRHSPELTETMSVRICGFPFGQMLSTSSRSPAISIGKGAVSSLRRNDAGDIVLVQVDGAINPGNSGGPVVDDDGRLVGVTVAKIRDSGLGFAIPSGELLGLLDGRVHAPLFLPVGVEDGSAVFLTLVPVADPLKKIKSISLLVKTDAGRSDGTGAGTDGPWEPLVGASRVELTLDPRGIAAGPLRLPVKEQLSVLLQLACAFNDGDTVYSRPVGFRLVVNAVQSAADAMPMSVLNRAPERYEGKTVVVRGQLLPGVAGRGEVYALQVANENGARPMNLEFLTTREIKAQLGELPSLEQMLPVRLTCRVGKKDPDGVARVRVTRIDFLGRGNRIIRTIPSKDGADDPLVALHRSPEMHVGKTITFRALLSPVVVGRGGEIQLQVMFLSRRRPDGLSFTCSRDLATQLHDQGLSGEAYLVRLTGRVERKPGSGYSVTVVKIEFLDEKGQTRKTLQ